MRIPMSFNMMGARGAEEVQTPLTFTAQQAGSTVAFKRVHGSPYTANIDTSTDGKNWTPYTIGTTITLSNIGDSVMFWNHKERLNSSTLNMYSFVMSGSISASGDLRSMINYGELTSYCFYYLFCECASLTTAPVIVGLPQDTSEFGCYERMFEECTSLTSLEVSFTSFSIDNTEDWVYHVAPTGTFRCPRALGTNETIRRGKSYCPSGWTVVNTD